jgi:hypothetical protein
VDEEGTAAMTTPREPRAPRDPYEPDDPTWGRSPAGGWGDEPGYRGRERGAYDPGGYDQGSNDPGGYDPGGYDPGGYDPQDHDTRGHDARGYGGAGRGGRAGGSGPYGGEPEYGWQQPEYEPAARYGADPPSGAGSYGAETGRRAPAWAPVSPGASAASRRSTHRRRGPRWVPLAAAAAVVVLLLVLGFVTPGWFVTRVFDAGAVQTGVAKILTDDYGAEGVADVRCPENVGVVAGATFTCDATIDGDPVKVPLKVTDGGGRYEVGRPA